MKIIRPDEWRPKEVALEPVAYDIVKDTENNIIVTAGPGRGKTELLAQKANYLLETGLCPNHKKILAISLKRDSAKNLKERVISRSGEELGIRFNSMTLDSFSKSILDRFRMGLPDNFRPTINYKINYDIGKNYYAEQFLENIDYNNAGLTIYDIKGINTYQFDQNFLCKNRLPIDSFSNTNNEEIILYLSWNKLLRDEENSNLSFKMISRLAELSLRVNPLLIKALRITYPYVFIDEFQDTTNIHYDLIKTCFLQSESKIIAVGDENQSIMGWAGALENIFQIYQQEFSATDYKLTINYRSAPKLIEIQKAIEQLINDEEVEKREIENLEGECKILVYENDDFEAKNISNLINSYITNEDLKPNDICILVRQKPDNYSDKLISELNNLGIKSRIENIYQELLCEEIIILIISFFKISINKQNMDHFNLISNYFFYENSSNYKEEVRYRKIQNNIFEFSKKLKGKLNNPNCVDEIINDILAYLDINRIKSTYYQYSQGNHLEDTIESFKKHLNQIINSSHTINWQEIIEEFEGINSVPILTIHKSKGLEYHTVIFVGLEDSAFWNYKNQTKAENQIFFVAFSRAKKRVLFTFSSKRKKKEGITNIRSFYDILTLSGVKAERIN